MLRALALFISIGSVLLAGCARAPLLVPHQPRDNVSLFRGVRVFDGLADTLSEPTDVLVEDGHIAKIARGLQAPAGAVTIAGGVLMPGLFDSHVHLGGVEGEPPWDLGKHLPDVAAQAAAHVWCGVTTAVMAGDNDTYAVARDINARRMSGPRLIPATRILTAPGGHPVPMYEGGALSGVIIWLMLSRTAFQVHDEAEMRDAVRKELALGAHHVKVVYHSMPTGTPHLSRALLVAAIDEARRLDRPVYVHVGTSSDAVEAAEAGAGVLMHVPWEDLLTRAQAEAIARTRVPVVTTVRIWTAWLNVTSGKPVFSPLELEVMRPGLDEVIRQRPEKLETPGYDGYLERAAEFERNQQQNAKLLREAGVTLVAGTDVGVSGIFPGASLHEELKTLVALGFPTAEVLKMATSTPEHVFEPGGRRGVIAVGAVADLLLLDADPLAHIEAIDRIRGVWKAGERQR